MRDLIVVGAGGFGREVLQYARDAAAAGAALRVRGFLDDRPGALDGFGLDVGVLGPIAQYRPRSGEACVVALGDPAARHDVVARLRAAGAEFATLVHPRAYVAPSAALGEGTVVAPFACICPHARLGAHVAVNVSANVGHDAVVEDFAVLSPFSVLNGFAVLGAGGFLGTHATISVQRRVGAWSKASAGTVVFRDVEPGSLVAGNPPKARVMFHPPAGA